MARADLLLNLVRAGSEGDQIGLRRTVEAMVAEERAKQHVSLANRLEAAMKTTTSQVRHANGVTSEERARQYFVELQAKRDLASMVLDDAVAEECAELIDENRRADLLRSYGLEPRHRVLLFGPPGNGKTSLAEALAFELALPFIVVRYETLIGSFLGETSQRLKQVFDFARTRHCVLFFDEFDAVAKERGDVHETGEIKRVVNSLLMQIDDLPSTVLIVVASNHSELLDRAVWRRFQVRLELRPPNKKAIAAWYALLQNRLNVRFSIPAAKFYSAFSGRSFSDLVAFSEDVARRAILQSPDANVDRIVEKLIRRAAAGRTARTKNA